MKARSTGFTLLELLIAMTLLGLVLIMLYSGLNTGMRSWEAGESRMDRVSQVRLLQEFLRLRLRQSVTVYRNDPDHGRVVWFEGAPDSVIWVAPMLRYLGLGGLYAIHLDTVPGDEDDVLRLRWYLYRPPEDGEEDVDVPEEEIGETALLEHVSDFRIAYYGPEEPDAEPRWHDRWENLFQRPSLISIRLALPDGTWPELRVALPE